MFGCFHWHTYPVHGVPLDQPMSVPCQVHTYATLSSLSLSLSIPLWVVTYSFPFSGQNGRLWWGRTNGQDDSGTIARPTAALGCTTRVCAVSSAHPYVTLSSLTTLASGVGQHLYKLLETVKWSKYIRSVTAVGRRNIARPTAGLGCSTRGVPCSMIAPFLSCPTCMP